MYNPFSSGVAAAKFTVTAVLSALLGYVASFLGGFDSLMITLLILIHFWLNISLADIPDSGAHFVKHYVSRILYTGAFFVPLYFLGRLFCTALKNE